MTARELSEGRYRIEDVVGAGGMATVYRGADERLHRPVAIKFLADNLATDAAFRDRFVREARLAARLAHRNVVRVYDVDEEEGRPYIVMEYVDGPSLAEVLERRTRLPWNEVVALAAQIGAGLDHAHAAGLVHRDVKPANLLLTSDGTVKIVDFGIARAVDGARLTQTGSVLGTAAYLAPEQGAGLPVTAAADIYSFGVVLHQLISGALPPSGGGTELPADVPEALRTTIARCLSVDPLQRPHSAGEVAAGGAGSPTGPDGHRTEVLPPTPAPLPARAAVPAPRRWWLAGVLGGAALLVAVALLAGAEGPKRPRPTAGTVPSSSPAPTKGVPAPTTTPAPPPTTGLGARTGCRQAGTDLAGQSLVGRSFAGMDLRCVDLSGANLAGVNFRDADLRDANLAGANLVGASFRDADLRGADLTGANLVGADWKDARCPDGREVDDRRAGCGSG